MNKENSFMTKRLTIIAVMVIVMLVSIAALLLPKTETASAASVSSKKYLNIQMPTGTKRLGMCVYIYDRPDAWDMGYYPEDVVPYFNGTLYLYFMPKTGANVYSGHYVTITGATLTGTKDLYVGVQGSWYSYVTAPSGEYEISSALYDILTAYPNYNIYITTNLSRVGQATSDTSSNWIVNLCTDIDKNPNNETYATTVVSYYSGVVVTPLIRAELPPDPVKAGYTFAGWYYDAAFTQPFDGAPIYGDFELYAKFSPIIYSITYNTNGGSLSGQTTSYTIESNNITYPSPSKTGYDFNGWYESSNFTGSPVTGIPKGSMGNKTVYAKFTPVIYSITYNTNGGSIGGQTTSYTIETNNISYPTPTKTGYTFDGWFENSGFTGSAVTGIPKGSTGNKTVYAKFTPINYTIIYNLGGGEMSGQTTAYTIESGAITLAAPARTGYEFKGWYDNADLTGAAISAIPSGSTGNRTYYAKWEILKYTITFYVDEDVYSEIVVEYGTVFDEFYLVNMTSLETVPLFLNAALTADFDMQTVITENMAVYSSSDFSVFVSLTYIVNGEEIAKDLLDYNSPLNSLRIPEIDGLEFAGWFYDAAFTHAVSASDKLTKNTTVYAKMVDPESASLNFWQKVGAWFGSPAGIITVIVVVLAGVLGGIGYAVKRKKSA